MYLLDTYACGTARVSRKEMPEAFKKSVSKEIKLTRGSGIFHTRDHLLALKYHDKRDIHMLSTIHTSECVIFDKKDSDGNYLSKPKYIVDYVKYMGGVDLNDQLLQYYAPLRKCVKWWRKLFFHLFNMMIQKLCHIMILDIH